MLRISLKLHFNISVCTHLNHLIFFLTTDFLIENDILIQIIVSIHKTKKTFVLLRI